MQSSRYKIDRGDDDKFPAHIARMRVFLHPRLVDELSQVLAETGVETHVIGDAASPRTAEEAVFEGLEVATRL